MHATITLATAQPARVASRVLAALDDGADAGAEAPAEDGGRDVGPVEKDGARAAFVAPDRLEVEGDAAWIEEAFEAVGRILDLPPRMVVTDRLEAASHPDRADRDLEERLWTYARIAAARHSPKARFEVGFDGFSQIAGAWLGRGISEVREVLEADLQRDVGRVDWVRIALGPGDSTLEVVLGEGEVRLVARDTAALEAIELLHGALSDSEAFRTAGSTFRQASSTPSEAAERERAEVEARNLARRTGYLLGLAEEPMATVVRRLGVARVRAYLEGPPTPPVSLDRRQEALEEIPTPGRARAIVRLLVCAQAAEPEALDRVAWLDRLAEEPEPARIQALEELVLLGVVPDEASRRLRELDEARAARALARACTEGEGEARSAAATALQGLRVPLIAEAFDPLPSFRDGLEACWEVVRPLMREGSRELGNLVTSLQHASDRLAESDPAARFLSARIAEARGDVEGAQRYYELAADRTADAALRARARRGAALLSFQRGEIEEALSALLRITLESDAAERAEALRDMATCFRRLDLPGFAGRAEAAAEDEGAADTLRLVEGWLASRNGDFEASLAAFGDVHARAPLDGEPARFYAAALRAASRDAEAITLLEEVCSRAPGDAESWYQLARLHHEAGALPECLRALEGALEADPRHGRALHLKGMVHEVREEFDEAIRCFGLVVELDDPVPAAFTGLARVQTAAGRFREAARTYKRSLEVAQECELTGYRELGELYESHLEDPEQALFWYQRYLTRGGEDREVLERFKKVSQQVTTYPRSVSQGVPG